jgi:hypothetical protein
MALKYITKRAVKNVLLFVFLIALTSLLLFTRLDGLIVNLIFTLSVTFTAITVVSGGFFPVIKNIYTENRINSFIHE